MRLCFLFVCSCLFLASCETKKDYRKDIQGNWTSSYVDENGDTVVLNLYFSDSICHIDYSQDNHNRYSVNNNRLEIHFWRNYERKKDERTVYYIQRSTPDTLVLIPEKYYPKPLGGNQPDDTLYFTRITKKTDQLPIRVSFRGGGCFGTCPVMDLEINADRSVSFVGRHYVEHTGTFTGKINEREWAELCNKIQYIDFSKWKERYGGSCCDAETTNLVIEFKGKIYKTHMYSDDGQPEELKALMNYISENYRSIPLKKRNRVNLHHEKILDKLEAPLEEKILQFIPPIK